MCIMTGSTVLTIAFTFLIAPLVLVQIQVDAIYYVYHDIPATTSRVNASFIMNVPVYGSEFHHRVCRVIPPATSTVPEIDFIKSRRYPVRIHFLGNFTADLNSPYTDCGFVLNPVWKSDEGNWTIVYFGWKALGQDSNIIYSGILKIDDPNMQAEVLPRSVVRNEGEETDLHLIAQSKGLIYDDYALKSCVVTLPNGTQIALTPNSATGNSRIRYSFGPGKRGLEEGYCSVAIKDAYLQDSGKWTLTAVHRASKIIFSGESTLEVTGRINAAMVPDIVEVYHGQQKKTCTLMMKVSGVRKMYSLDTCLARAPNGTVFQLTNTGNTTEDSGITNLVAYAGRGLHEGDCGVTFASIEPDMKGNWVFEAKISQTLKVLTAACFIDMIFVKGVTEKDQVPEATVLIIVLAMGLVIAVSVIVALLYVTYKRSTIIKRNNFPRNNAREQNHRPMCNVESTEEEALKNFSRSDF